MVTTERALALIDAEFRILDIHAGGAVEDVPRQEAIATISAGYKDEKGMPVRSRDGKIFLHDTSGRAPELARILETADFKRLTVAFPFNDPADFIQQRFAAYSKTALLAYGDERAITVLEGGRRTVPAGTTEYATWVAKCRPQFSVFFCLSEWDESGIPLVSMPDGAGFYRLRTTSPNSLRSLLSGIRYAGKFTRGRVAGLPFTLSIDQRDLATGDGTRQRVPVWVAVMQPPGGIHLTSRTFAVIARQALDESASLYLPAPASETVETALIEAEIALAADDDFLLSDDEADLMSRGGACKPADYTARWFAMVRGTILEPDLARAAFIEAYCDRHYGPATDSLSEFLKHATDVEALDLLSAAELHIANAVVVDPGTGEILAEPFIEAELDEPTTLSPVADALFSAEPDALQSGPIIPMDTEKRAKQIREWFKSRIPVKSSELVARAVAKFEYDRLAEVCGSVLAGAAVLQFLMDKPGKLFTQLTVAESNLLDLWMKTSNGATGLALITPVAKRWVDAQKVTA